MAYSLARVGALRQDRPLCVSANAQEARLARERRMKDQQWKRAGDALRRRLRRARSWTQWQVKSLPTQRIWISWSLAAIVVAGSLFAISSTHLANIQNAISGLTQPSVGQAVLRGPAVGSDTREIGRASCRERV